MNNSEIINETIEEKMEKYLNDYKNGLNTEIQEKMNKEWNINCSFKYGFSEDIMQNIIKNSNLIFNQKTIREKYKVYIFIHFLERYIRGSQRKMLNSIHLTTTSNKRKDIKKKNAINGAYAIIDYLGGMYSDNENAANLKSFLHHFLKNVEDYEIKEHKLDTSKEDLEYNINLIIKDKSLKIREFIKKLPNILN